MTRRSRLPDAIYGFPESEAPAHRLAVELGVPYRAIGVHRFPDGETRITATPAVANAVVYRSLDRPNERLVELMLAASALRDQGGRRLTLLAPYMAYMRQDAAFEEGEAVSQRAVGAWLGRAFDRVVTVNPHLHRTPSLADVFPGAEAIAVDAAPALAAHIAALELPDAVLIGPDEESAPLVQTVGALARRPTLIGRKTRTADRSVSIEIDGIERVAGAPAIVIDDIVSSGATLAACARLLRRAGATRTLGLIVHALYSPETAQALKDAGVERIASTDTVPHPTNAIMLAVALAGALRRRP
jgi:ribose-phosphate pyrophosphokinase